MAKTISRNKELKNKAAPSRKSVAVVESPRIPKKRKLKKRPVGRPIELTGKMMDKICLEIACGQSLRAILSKRNFPSESTFFEHLSVSGDFRSRYSAACELRACHNLEDIVELTDKIGKDYSVVKNEYGEVAGYVMKPECAPGVVMAKIKSKQWLMAKQYPKKYGAKVDFSGETKITGKLGLLSTKTDDEIEEILEELTEDE